MQHAFGPHFPFSSSDCYWQAVRKRFVRKFYFVFIVIFNAVRPRPSSVPLILVFRCHPQAKYTPGCGGGGGEGGGGRVGGVRPRCRSAARGGGAPRRDDAPGRPFVFVVQFEILIRFHSSFCIGPSPPRSSPRSSPRTSPRFSLRPHLRTSSQTSLLRYFDASLLRCFFVWCSHDENKKKIFLRYVFLEHCLYLRSFTLPWSQLNKFTLSSRTAI